VDELQDFWQRQPPGAKVPPPILELSKHGKRGIDFYFITQEPELVHSTPRSMCQHHYFVVRAFGSHNVMIYKFERMQLHPDKVKTKGEKFPWRYNKAAFNWYKSADTHNVKRQIPLKLWGIPAAAVLAGLAVSAGINMFNGVLEKAKGAGGGVPAMSVPGARPVGVVASPGAPQSDDDLRRDPVLTVAEYTSSYQPRVHGFPQSAPRYDDLTKATQVPKPAACIDGIRPGSKVRTCSCWTQQATPVSVPKAMCQQIAAYGWFDDTLPLDQSPGMATPPSPAPSVQAPPVSTGNILVSDFTGLVTSVQ
jgi:zona occludens toxin